MSGELKPCPFCGSKELRFRLSDIEGWIAHVECMRCDDMLGPMSQYKYDDKADAEKDAADVWNRRANNSDGSKVIVIGEETISALRQGKEVGITNGMFLILASDLAPALSSTEGTEG
jgi:Lar family restriction alleviation protein